MSIIKTATLDTGEKIEYDLESKPHGGYSREIYYSTDNRYVIKCAGGYSYSQSEQEISAYEALVVLGMIENAEKHGVSVPVTMRGIDHDGDVCSVQERIMGDTLGDTLDYDQGRDIRSLVALLFPSNTDIHGGNIMVGPEGDLWVVDLGFDETDSGQEN